MSDAPNHYDTCVRLSMSKPCPWNVTSLIYNSMKQNVVRIGFGRHGDFQTFSHSSGWLGTFVHLFLVALSIKVS